jgi:hypothetical protein
MTAFRKARPWAVSACAAIAVIALSASAPAEVLFDSLSSQNSGVVGDDPFIAAGGFAATFDTGASAVRLMDVALLLNSTFPYPATRSPCRLRAAFRLPASHSWTA